MIFGKFIIFNFISFYKKNKKEKKSKRKWQKKCNNLSSEGEGKKV